MSSYHSRIAERFASHPGTGNRASAPFFLAMAGFAVRSAIAWLDRAEKDRPGIVDEHTEDEVKALVKRIDFLERCARRSSSLAQTTETLDEAA